MSDPFKEFGGEEVEDPFKEFGGAEVSARKTKKAKEEEKGFLASVYDKAEKFWPQTKYMNEFVGGDLKKIAYDPSWENLKTFGDDTPASSAISGGIKSAYLGFDDEIVEALGGEEEAREYKERQKQSEKENPASFLGGEMASAFATPSGAAQVLQAAKHSKTLAKIAKESPKLAAVLANMTASGAQGAAMGAGYSEGDDLGGDTLEGLSYGAAVPGVLGAAGKALSKVPKKGTFKLVTGMDDLEFDTSATKDLDTAKTTEEMETLYKEATRRLDENVLKAGDSVDATLGKYDDMMDLPGVGKPVSQGVEDGIAHPDDPFLKAKDIAGKVAPEGTFSVDELKNFTDRFVKDRLMEIRPKAGGYGFVNDDARKAAKNLNKFVNNMTEGMHEFIPEDRVNRHLKELTKKVNYKSPSPATDSVKAYMGAFTDDWYNRNVPLGEAKREAGKALDLRSRGEKYLSPEVSYDGKTKIKNPSDKVKTFEKRVLQDENFSTKRFAEDLKNATGIDIYDDSVKRAVLESTKGGAATGFWERVILQKSTLAAGAAGAGLAYSEDPSNAASGGMVGLALGAGRAAAGKRLGREFLQNRLRANPENIFVKAAKGTPTQQKKLAEEYLSKGDKGMAASLYLMMSRDRRMREQDGDNN